ncbi:MAG: glycosyltransferase [Sedimenticola sp.]
MPVDVSIIIPFYNSAAYLDRSIQSALKQGGGQIEVIAVDDGSNDDSVELAAVIDDPRFRLLRLPDNQGVAEARNAALKIACGEWVQFLDSDDYLEPDKLECQLSAGKGADVLYCDWLEVDESTGKRELCRPWFDPQKDHLMQLLAGNVFPIHSLLVRRSVLQAVGGFDTNVYHEDWALWVSLASLGVRFRYTPISGAVYWKRRESRSYDPYKIALNDLEYLSGIEKRGIQLEEQDKKALLRKKYYELALLSLTSRKSDRAQTWLHRCAPLLWHEYVEVFLAGRPSIAWLNGYLPGPRKLRRWLLGWWHSLNSGKF